MPELAPMTPDPRVPTLLDDLESAGTLVSTSVEIRARLRAAATRLAGLLAHDAKQGPTLVRELLNYINRGAPPEPGSIDFAKFEASVATRTPVQREGK